MSTTLIARLERLQRITRTDVAACNRERVGGRTYTLADFYRPAELARRYPSWVS